jgi:Tfp pilus assembly protein FimT
MALSSFIVLPNIEKKLQERAIRVSALGLAAVARHTRSRALDQGFPQRLIVNLSQNSYRSEGEKEVFLPPDVKFGDVIGGEPIDPGAREFVFFPNGSSYGGDIRLASVSRDVRYSVRFEPLTGKIEVSHGDPS